MMVAMVEDALQLHEDAAAKDEQLVVSNKFIFVIM